MVPSICIYCSALYYCPYPWSLIHPRCHRLDIVGQRWIPTAPLILPKKKDLVYALGKVDTAVPARRDVTKVLLLLHLPLPQSSVGAVCVIIDPAPLVASLRRLRHCR